MLMDLAFSCFQILYVCVLLSAHVLQKFHEFRMADFFILVVKKCVGVGACITRFTHGIEIRDFFEQAVIDLVKSDFFRIIKFFRELGIQVLTQFICFLTVAAGDLYQFAVFDFYVFIHNTYFFALNPLQCCFL